MTPNLIAFGAVHVVSIAIMLAFVTLETTIQSDRRRRSSQRKLQRDRARRFLWLHRLRIIMRTGGRRSPRLTVKPEARAHP